MLKLENWAIISRSTDPFKAPEQATPHLCGNVFGHPRCVDGEFVTTTTIKGKRDNKVVTRSGSEYTLGEVNSGYEHQYPNAYNRLMDSLDEL